MVASQLLTPSHLVIAEFTSHVAATVPDAAELTVGTVTGPSMKASSISCANSRGSRFEVISTSISIERLG